MTALVDERDDEYLTTLDVVEDAPGVGGHFTQLFVIDLWHLAAEVRQFRHTVGLLLNLPYHRLGIERRVLGDVIVNGFEVSALAPTTSPLLNLFSQFVAGDHSTGFNVLYALMGFIEHVEAIDDLIQRYVIRQTVNDVESILLGAVRLHAGLLYGIGRDGSRMYP